MIHQPTDVQATARTAFETVSEMETPLGRTRAMLDGMMRLIEAMGREDGADSLMAIATSCDEQLVRVETARVAAARSLHPLAYASA